MSRGEIARRAPPQPSTASENQEHRGQRERWLLAAGPAAPWGEGEQGGPPACVHLPHPAPPHCFKGRFLPWLILQTSGPHFEDEELGGSGAGLCGRAQGLPPSHVPPPAQLASSTCTQTHTRPPAAGASGPSSAAGQPPRPWLHAEETG